jgi:alkanesulfonate monooxygenase SsuD/methylene tetrahydromethanopterin reductase-like flavin-dependent oxidoreductase (luciferase family)
MAMSGAAMPVGVNLTTIGVSAGWWLGSARRLEAAGYAGVWSWDHFVSRGRLDDPMLECWTTLAATAAVTSRIRVGSFVSNVMNRHPAVLARMVATIADLAPGRVELGIGIGGHPAEHAAYGIDFPAPSERAARLEEAVAVLRALFTGGPVSYEGAWYRLREAYASPAPSPVPRIVIGGERPAGARLAARIGDAWTCMADSYDQLRPVFDAALAAAGRRPSEVAVIVGCDLPRDEGIRAAPAIADPMAWAEGWRERGADELVLHWVTSDQLDHVLDAGERAWA